MAGGAVSENHNDPWFLAQLKPGGLERAVTNLARQGYESFMPMREETRRRAGRWDRVRKPLFPGYLFVKVPLSQMHWRSINSTYGVARIVALEAGRPTRVDPDLVAALKVRFRFKGELKQPAELEVGNRVRVITGPLADNLAEIEAVPERGRIHVLLQFMGRYTRAVLATDDVESV